jgi:hypothetical protein
MRSKTGGRTHVRSALLLYAYCKGQWSSRVVERSSWMMSRSG